MRYARLSFALLAFVSTSGRAEIWSIGGGIGPFIFGHFVERTVSIRNETGTATTTSRLSAETRPGIAADVERDLTRRLAIRLEATWNRSPLRIKSRTGDQGATIESGHLNLTTFVLPLVVRINPNGALRFDVMGGPAYAFYTVHVRSSGSALPLFAGTRARWGGAGAVGVAWWWRSNFGVEWQAQEIVTSSPFGVEDFAPVSQGIHIPKPRNGHTTVGIRYRF